MIQQKIQPYLSKSLEDTEVIGKAIADSLTWPACVYLDAEMGAGKTTLCKSIIASFGYIGEVTSPTYNLIQEYPVSNGVIYHVDLYRLEDPSEMEFLALEDLWTPQCIFLIEWPNRGGGHLPQPTHKISIIKKRANNDILREIIFKKRN